MPYLIDGHNLISHLSDIDLDDPDDEMQLVNKLRGFYARSQKKCTVIFDNGILGGKSPVSTIGVQVEFASGNQQSADDILRQRIAAIRDPQGWTLVSSDNEVLQAGRAHGMRIMRSQEFAVLLQLPASPMPEAGEWTNPRVSPDEVQELLSHFEEGAPPPAPATSPKASPKPKASKPRHQRSSSTSDPKSSTPQPTTHKTSSKHKPSAPRSIITPSTPPPAPAEPSEPSPQRQRYVYEDKPLSERPAPVWKRGQTPPPSATNPAESTPRPERPISQPPLNPLKAGGYLSADDQKLWQDYAREELPLPPDISGSAKVNQKRQARADQQSAKPAPSTPAPSDLPKPSELGKAGKGTLTDDDVQAWQDWVEKYGKKKL